VWSWWRKRREGRNRIAREAEALVALHGDSVYAVAREHRMRALRDGEQAEHRFWCAVARMIADRTGREVGVDTATRYLMTKAPGSTLGGANDLPHANAEPTTSDRRVAERNVPLVPNQ
jgi:hypothetical protein